MSANQAVLDFLSARKSVPLSQISYPGPDDETLMLLLKIAARAPDHGRMEPWRFMIYRGKPAIMAGEAIAALALKKKPSLSDEELAREKNRLNRAPLAIGVVSNVTDTSNIPEWEQFLSAGAVAMNLVTAATAAGFAANWVTGWFCDDAEGRSIIGLRTHERMAGIIHIGSCDVKIPDRPRPQLDSLISEFAYSS